MKMANCRNETAIVVHKEVLGSLTATEPAS
jgi:hypothetical protein